jgi:deazaflavin-dependent oxidoreductase (nitroreductase family)
MSTSSPSTSPHRTAAMERWGIQAAVALYRLASGAIGGRVGPERVLLLTTTGRKSGRRRTIPVSYFEDGSTLFVIASNAGRAYHPAWYLNLSAHPQAEIQIRRKQRHVQARKASPEERARLLAYASSQNPRRNEAIPTTRAIPVVVLQPVAV